MSAVPVSDGVARRTIGDILLAHGFVSEEALAEACAEQAQTAQPLGQILVQRGVITRLELASALAEQWSDPSASIKILPRPAPGGPVASQPQDDARYAARLQDAVADLARRVQASQPLEGVDARISELSQRIDATVARTQRLEATMATLAEGLEGVTTGVEEAFAGLQAGASDLAVGLAQLDRAVADLAARPAEAALPDPLLSERLDERLERLETHLAQSLATFAGADTVGALAERVKETAAAQDGLVAAIEAIDSRLREIDARDPRMDLIATRLDAMEARLETGAAAVAALSDAAVTARAGPTDDGRLEALSTAVAAVQEELAALAIPAAGLAERLDELTAERADRASLGARLDRVEALAEDRVARGDLEAHAALLGDLSATLADLEARPAGNPDLDERLELLEQRLVEHADAAAPAAPPDDGRLEALSMAVAAVQEELLVLAIPADGLAERLDELAARVGQLATETVARDPLAERLESVEARLADDLDTIDVLARAIDRIRGDLEGAAASPPDSGPADGTVAVLEERLAALEALGARVDELAQTVDERIGALGAPRSRATDEPAGAADELERVRMAIERVGLHLGEHDRALAELMLSRGVSQRLEELAARVDELAATGSGAGPTAGSGGSSVDVSEDVRALMRRVAEAETASQSDREKLMSRLERMASSIDWRLQRLEVDEST